MSESAGWQPLSSPRRRAGADAFHLSPFARLARAHVLTALGDALVTIALAGSLFFDVDPNEARWKVFLYLVLTVAPLGFVAPFIGPALDRARGGRRWMVVAVNALRAVVCLFMLDDLNSLLLFPEAFAVLAMGKAYGVARAALVPTVVRNDHELVEANSKLQLLSGLAAPGAAVMAGPAYLIAQSQGVLAVAVVVYLVGTIAALRIPSTQVASMPVSEEEHTELRALGVVLASSAMALVRGMVGFVTLLLLFGLRADDKWHLGIVAALTGAGVLLGAALAPALRRRLDEERMLMVMLGVTVVVGVGAALAGGDHGSTKLALVGAVVAATIAIVSTSSRLAFDSLVQRDAPDANRGRSFARFEVRFQLAWVIGAIIPPLLLPLSLRVGFVGIAGVAAFALFSYVPGQRPARRQHAARGGDRTPNDERPEDDPAGSARPHDRPTVFDAPPGPVEPPGAGRAPDGRDGDHAGWQVSEPSWGHDPTEADRTRVQGYPEDPTLLQ
jgi:hypothetical protein